MGYSKRRQEMGEEAWAEYQRQRNIKKVLAFKARNEKLFADRAAESRRRRKVKLIEYKGGECEICGYNKPIPAVFEFHHPDPEAKEFTIANRNLSLERMKQEADKCQLLCGNCHAELHHNLYLQKRMDCYPSVGRKAHR